MSNFMNFSHDHKENRNHIIVALVMAVIAMAFSSIASASDLEIYQRPTGGQRTLMMMLDTSGSMSTGSIYDDYGADYYNDYGCGTNTGGSGSYTYTRYFCPVADASVNQSLCNADGNCYDRISRLKDGMFAVMNSTDSKLNAVVMGVGNFSSNGDGKTGEILVPAAALGAVGSTQRNAIKAAIMNLSAQNGTPSAQAMAEAAAYLMGTSTDDVTASSGSTTDTVVTDIEKMVQTNYSKSSSECKSTTRTNGYKCTVYQFYSCATYNPTNFTNDTQTCQTWNTTTDPAYPTQTLLRGDSPPTVPSTWFVNGSGNPTIYQTNTTQTNPNPSTGTHYTYSGFSKSVSSSKSTSNPLVYQSPLPTTASSCQGQGIYFLSDGVPNSSSDTIAAHMMRNALNDQTFTCAAPALSNTTSDSGWACMSDFAKRIYTTNNPSGVQLKTAFVGFGSVFSSLSTTDAKNACQLGSRLSGDTCSPGAASNANPTGGYGNGGFYQANSSDQVTTSVLNFIDNLGNSAISPLVTGAATIPIDSLNPTTFQPYGYLRMLEANPANQTTLLWRGNLKKYNVVNGALEDANNAFVLNSDGSLATGTQGLWSSSIDSGNIALGGTYAKIPMPTSSDVLTAAAPRTIRPLFSNYASDGTELTTSGASLFNVIPTNNTGGFTNSSYVLNQFNTGTLAAIGAIPTIGLRAQLRLLNYLGYDVALDSAALPTTLTAPTAPFKELGATIHAQPIQLTYSDKVNSDGTFSTNATDRKESVLYGTMEGALHLVDATSSTGGGEQMVFVPKKIIESTNAGDALRPTQVGTPSPTAGIDGPLVADPIYAINRSTSTVSATQMNVYFGMRMGGSSYYGLDLLTPTAPKLLFRIGSDRTDLGANFSHMGQSWSKPVLANVRYNGVITRVMFIGGGYDPQYEVPTYSPTTSAPALGNAVYMVNAKTGALLWSATYSSSATDGRQYMINSIPTRISTLDRDGDGLVDHIYYGDLGGQVFRSDFNNAYSTTAANFGVRTVRLANLNTDSTGVALTNGAAPRFYEAPTVTFHKENGQGFIMLGIASGNRSSPLDTYFTSLGGLGLARPANNVYGIIDRDFSKTDLITNTNYVAGTASTGQTELTTHDKNLSNFTQNPQVSPALTAFYSGTYASSAGWYRSLSSNAAGTELATTYNPTPPATGVFQRALGGMKAFEEPVAVTGTLLVSVYDPEGTGVTSADPCNPRVVGESDYQKFCLPYGNCTATNFITNTSTGFVRVTSSSSGQVNGNVIGAGIRGLALGDPNNQPSQTPGPKDCSNLAVIGNQSSLSAWSCTRSIVPTRWYEKQPNPSKVK